MKKLILALCLLPLSAFAQFNQLTISEAPGATVEQATADAISLGCKVKNSSAADDVTLLTVQCDNFTYTTSTGAVVHITDIADSPLSTQAQIIELENKATAFIESLGHALLVSANIHMQHTVFEYPREPWATTQNDSCYDATDEGTGVATSNSPIVTVIDSHPPLFAPFLRGNVEWGTYGGEQGIIEYGNAVRGDPDWNDHGDIMTKIISQIGDSIIIPDVGGAGGSVVDLNNSVTRAINNHSDVISFSMTTPGPKGQKAQQKAMERAFNNDVLPVQSFGNGFDNEWFGNFANHGYDNEKTLTITNYHHDGSGAAVPNTLNCALPGQEPPDIAINSGHVSYNPNSGNYGSSSESTAMGAGYGADLRKRYPNLTDAEIMAIIINSTKVRNNTPTKDACMGYGVYDHCAAKAYAKRNFPTDVVSLPTDTWFPYGDGGSPWDNPFYVVYAGVTSNPHFEQNSSMRNAFKEKCNRVGGFIVDEVSIPGSPGNAGTVCWADSAKSNIKSVGLIWGIAARNPVTLEQIVGTNEFPGGFRYSAWPDGIPH
jgi:hypothetical protein